MIDSFATHQPRLGKWKQLFRTACFGSSFFRLSLLVSFTLFLSFGNAFALEGSVVRTPHVTAQFITAENSWSDQSKHTLALYFDIIDGWHVYWKNPGDSGIPTSFKWKLPPGVKIANEQWPYPERIDIGPITNFGYHESTAILFEVDHSQFRGAESSLRIRADVDWLVCEETCIPESGSFEITMPLDGKMSRDDKSAGTIDHFLARIPRPLPDAEVKARTSENWLEIKIPESLIASDSNKIEFFAEDEFLLQHNNRPRVERKDGKLVVYASRNSTADTAPPKRLEGVLVVGDEPALPYQVSAKLSSTKANLTPSKASMVAGGSEVQSSKGKQLKANVSAPAISLWKILLFAFLGGLLLNLMPCVFPVLAIKVLGFVKHAGSKKAKVHGFVYGAGVIASFLVLGLLMVFLRAAGAELGWGFHLQSPAFLSFLVSLLFMMSLNLFGYFEIAGSFMGVGQKLTEGDSHLASFCTGVLAVVVATPCTAPFMGTAIGASLTLPPAHTLLIFFFLGFGLALPYVLLASIPSLAKRMPKPGAWMQTFREALAFPMLATCIWLLWVLVQQAGANGLVVQLTAMAIFVFAVWLGKRMQSQFAPYLSFALILFSIGFGVKGSSDAQDSLQKLSSKSQKGKLVFVTDLIEWGTYSEGEIRRQLDSGKVVLVNFTAAWCITCKVNERVAFASEEVRDYFNDKKAIGLIGDWTNRDPEITKALSRHGRLGVPLYLVYHPGEEKPQILPQVLTPKILLDALKQKN